MNKVRILPAEIISKIAAGEVVERPASVVKELIENSIDARAASIEINLENSGKTLIRVKDNGDGISGDDLNTIFNRHATSKIAEPDDLYQITSLGFRGEALYSISAISDITLRTKTEEAECGWELHLRGNEKLSQKPITMHKGTDIEVKELFFNTPARKKFLKSNSGELKAILDICIPYTLFHPGISFYLAHEARKIIDLKPTPSLIGRISGALHLEQKHVLEDKGCFEGISIHLILGDINLRRSRKDMQFIFINGRPVQNKAINYHLNDIYRLLFSQGVYPVFCVYITMPPQELDVNVHPTKREVKIKNETELISKLRALAENALMTKSKARQFEKSVFSLPLSGSQTLPTPKAETAATLPSLSTEKSPPAKDDAILFRDYQLPQQKDEALKAKLRLSRYLGNLLNKYLLFESNDSLLVIDQHAAHERINFEKLKMQMENGKVQTQYLLTPVLVKLIHQEILSWEENKEILERMGFSCSLFDPETLAVHAHPWLITDPENSIRNLLSAEPIRAANNETLARRACHSSITTGYAVKKDEAEYQLSQLLLCQNPFSCPHGRPTVIEIPENTLNKQFLRT